MNPDPLLLKGYDQLWGSFTTLVANAIPSRTNPSCIHGGLDDLWTTAEIQWAKDHDHSPESARGMDGVSCRQLLNIDKDTLCRFFNDRVQETDAPLAWFITRIVAVLKRDRPPSDPNSYRTIGLESCFLKFLTLLIHKRLYDWAERNHIIPHSQNGFRSGYRTNNNAFVLRTLIETARAQGLPLSRI
jgi:hypothetical protein